MVFIGPSHRIIVMRHVDLCSGIGGFSLAFEEVGLSKTIMFCDTEKWCRDILAKHWPNVPITNDVKELANDPERNVPDCEILTAGYPCQPFSVAGKQRGAEDDRHIWPYIFRIVASKRPTWCVFENVYGHVGMGLDEVLHDLESEGYSTRTFIVPASGIGAPHKRDRLWIVAHTGRELWGQGDTEGVPEDTSKRSASSVHNQSGSQGQSSDVAHTESGRRRRNGDIGEAQGRSQSNATQFDSFGAIPPRPNDVEYSNSINAQGQRFELNSSQSSGLRCGEAERSSSGGQSQPKLGGMADGLPTRLDGFDGWDTEPEDIPRVVTGMKGRANRLKGLGNAIVPQIAMNIALAIKETQNAKLK